VALAQSLEAKLPLASGIHLGISILEPVLSKVAGIIVSEPR